MTLKFHPCLDENLWFLFEHLTAYISNDHNIYQQLSSISSLVIPCIQILSMKKLLDDFAADHETGNSC